MANETQCYNEDGTESNDIFCGFSSLGTCCGDGWDCLSNGLCRNHGTTAISQGTCTDKSFNPKNCLSFCNKSDFGGFTEVSRCGDNSWCCAGVPGQGGGGNDCCDQNPTSLEPFPFSAVQRVSGQTPIPMASPASSSSASLASTSSFVPSSTPSRPVQAEPSSAGSLSSTSATPAPTNTNISSAGSGGLSTGSKIGIGVAVPVVAVLLAALLFLFLQNRKHRRALQQSRAQVQLGSKNNTHDQSMLHNMQEGYGGELDAWEDHELANADHERHELGGLARHEMNGNGMPQWNEEPERR